MKLQSNIKNTLILISFILLLAACGSSNSNNNNTTNQPSSILVTYLVETQNSNTIHIGSTAYEVNDLNNLAEATMINPITFHMDKKVEVWIDTDTQEESTEVFISSILTSGLQNMFNELLDLWTISKVEPNEYYHLDFTDSDNTLYQATIPSEEFVGISNLEDDDTITDDNMTILWDKTLVTGNISISLTYTDPTTEEDVEESFENIPNTGTYSFDASTISGDIDIAFIHCIEPDDTGDFGDYGIFALYQLTNITITKE